MATKSLGTTFTFNNTPVGTLSAISEMTCDSEMIDVTTLASPDGCREYMQGAKDCGEIRLTGFHTHNEAGQAPQCAAKDEGALGNCCITFPDGAKATFRALVKSHALGAAQVDSAIQFVCVLRVSGKVVFS